MQISKPNCFTAVYKSYYTLCHTVSYFTAQCIVILQAVLAILANESVSNDGDRSSNSQLMLTSDAILELSEFYENILIQELGVCLLHPCMRCFFFSFCIFLYVLY